MQSGIMSFYNVLVILAVLLVPQALACWSSKTCTLTKHSKNVIKPHTQRLERLYNYNCDGWLEPKCSDVEKWLMDNYQTLDDDLLVWYPYYKTITGERLQDQNDKRDQDVKRYLACQGSPDNCGFPNDCTHPPCNTCMHDPWNADVHPHCKNKPGEHYYIWCTNPNHYMTILQVLMLPEDGGNAECQSGHGDLRQVRGQYKNGDDVGFGVQVSNVTDSVSSRFVYPSVPRLNQHLPDSYPFTAAIKTRCSGLTNSNRCQFKYHGGSSGKEQMYIMVQCALKDSSAEKKFERKHWYDKNKWGPPSDKNIIKFAHDRLRYYDFGYVPINHVIVNVKNTPLQFDDPKMETIKYNDFNGIEKEDQRLVKAARGNFFVYVVDLINNKIIDKRETTPGYRPLMDVANGHFYYELDVNLNPKN